MKSTSGRFSALIIFDGTIEAIQQQRDNKPVVPLVYNGTILPRKASFWTFCGDLPGGSHQPLFPGGDFPSVLPQNKIEPKGVDASKLIEP